MAERVGAPLLVALAGFLESDEFGRRVVQSFASSEPINLKFKSGYSREDLVSWVIRRFVTPPEMAQTLREGRTWKQVDLAFLSDEQVLSALSERYREVVASSLREYKRLSVTEETSTEVLGAIDYASSDQVVGWCADRTNLHGKRSVEIFIDNVFAGSIACNEFRRELLEKVGGDGGFGFRFVIPATLRHCFNVDRWIVAREARSHLILGKVLCHGMEREEQLAGLARLRDDVRQLREDVERLEAAIPRGVASTNFSIDDYGAYYLAAYGYLTDEDRPAEVQSTDMLNSSAITIFIIVDAIDPTGIDRTWRSIEQQQCGRLSLLFVVFDPSYDEMLDSYISGVVLKSSLKPRIGVQRANVDSWAATLEFTSQVERGYCGFLRVGDRLSPHALLRCAEVINKSAPKLIYGDEDTIDKDMRHSDPILKPDFDFDLFASTNYIGLFCLYSTEEVVQRLHAVRAATPSSLAQAIFVLNADIGLRTRDQDIYHINEVIYHSRMDQTPQLSAVERARSLNWVFSRHGTEVKAEACAEAFNADGKRVIRLLWGGHAPAPSVSVIIPTRDHIDLLRDCLGSLFVARGEFSGQVEIIVIDNNSAEPESIEVLAALAGQNLIRLLPYRGEFNWSAINNKAAGYANGQVLLFLNNDTRVISRGWFEELATQAMRSDVGAVGARLLYSDGTVQHGGVIVGLHGVADHDGVGEPGSSGGYLGRLNAQRSLSAVTGACIATRKTVWETLGGFRRNQLPSGF